jgi:hypothetical protein
MYKRLYVKKKPPKTPVYQFREKDFNFLKYHRVVKYYIKNKYEISGAELDMILFLYDENVFTKTRSMTLPEQCHGIRVGFRKWLRMDYKKMEGS